MNNKRSQPAWRKKEQEQYRHTTKTKKRSSRGQNSGYRRENQQPSQQRKEVPPWPDPPNVGPTEVVVYNNDVGQALRVLKNKMSKEGVLQELKYRRSAEKPSIKKRRKHREALKRSRKSKGRTRRLNLHKHGGSRSKVVRSVPTPIQEE